MPLNALGVLDLSIITNRLIDLLNDYWQQSPLWATLSASIPTQTFAFQISGAMPEAVRSNASSSGCQVSIYLFHVAQDKFQRNAPVTGPYTSPPKGGTRVPPIPYQPLSLELYYLVTAFEDQSYIHEQQAMSIVLSCFHENPIVRDKVTIPGQPQGVDEEFTLTMEVETSNDLAQLWQAVSAPFRFSVVYKVSVVFITPPAPPVLAAPVQTISLAADPTTLPYAQNGQVVGTLRTVTFLDPTGTPVSFDASPATVAPSPPQPLPPQRFILYGAGLNQGASYQGPPPNPGTSYRVYLLFPDNTEQEVTSWKVPEPDPSKPPVYQTESRITLELPGTVGAPPANSPPPGVYQLRTGSNVVAAGDATTYRTNATPFSIAARVDAVNPPLLSGTGPHTLNGAGFIPGKTEVLLDTVPLTETASAPPGFGQFTVDGSGTALTFQAPSTLTGRYIVRVRVNQVESAPAWWIDL